jgi:hypothetical protein
MTRSLVAVASAAVVALAAGRAGAQDLEPPPPMATSPSAPTYYNPNTSDQSQDSGLGLEWVYLNADAGGAYTNLQSLSESHLALQQTSSAGGAFGVAAGVRLLFFTLGARARDLQLSSFNLWELDGEAAFHIRIWRIDPYFGVRGGYAFVGTLGSGAVSLASGSSTSDVSVHGINVGPTFGIDVYLSSLVSLGVDANAEFLFLQRPPAPLPPGITQADVAMLPAQQQQLYSLSGSSIGFGAVLTAHLGIHF